MTRRHRLATILAAAAAAYDPGPLLRLQATRRGVR